MNFPTLKREIDRLRILNWLHTVVPTMGNVYYVFNTSNTYYTQASRLLNQTYYDNTQAVHTSIESAYAATTSGRNDVILIDGNSTHTLTDKLDVTKSRVNFVGMDGGDRLVQQGAKLEISGATDVAYVIKDTGTRNRFENIKVIQASTHANALTSFQAGGEGTVFKNFSATFGVADNLDETTATEFVAGTDSATYINCEFGQATLTTSAARKVFTIDQVTTNQEFKDNRMVDCNFAISSSETTAVLLGVAANTDVLFANLLKNCTFVASIDSAGGAALAVGVSSVASLVKGTLNFHNCAAYGCTNLMSDAVGNDNFFAYGTVGTGTDMVGVLGIAT